MRMCGESDRGVWGALLCQLYFSGGFPTARHGRMIVAPLDTFTDPANNTMTGFAEKHFKVHIAWARNKFSTHWITLHGPTLWIFWLGVIYQLFVGELFSCPVPKNWRLHMCKNLHHSFSLRRWKELHFSPCEWSSTMITVICNTCFCKTCTYVYMYGIYSTSK